MFLSAADAVFWHDMKRCESYGDFFRFFLLLYFTRQHLESILFGNRIQCY